MHQVALEEQLEPGSIFTDRDDDTGGVLNALDNALGTIKCGGHEGALSLASNVPASLMTFPDEVRGSDSRTTIFCGTLKLARLARRKAKISFSTILSPGLATMAAPITAPRLSSGIGKTTVS